MMVLFLSQISDTVWVKVFPRSGEQRMYSGVVEDYGIVLSGYTTELGDRDGYVVAVDTSGNIVWETVVRIPGSDEVLRDIVKVPGGYVAAGWEGMPGARNVFVVRLDPSGNVLWDTVYTSPDEEGLYGITYDPHRRLLWGAGFYRPGGDSTYGGYVVSIDTNGTLTPSFRLDTAIYMLDTIVNVKASCYNVSVGPDGSLAIDCKVNRWYFDLAFVPYTCFTDSSATNLERCLPLISWTADPGDYIYGFSALTVFRDTIHTFTGSTVAGGYFSPNVTGLSVWIIIDWDPMPVHWWGPATPDTLWETFPVWGDGVGDSLFVWMAVSRDLSSNMPYYDPHDTTAPFPEPGDMDDARIVLFFAVNENGIYVFRRHRIYDFPRADVGVSAKVIPGDSTDYLIAGYSNSFTSDLDVFVMRVRPDRVGVDERITHGAVVEGDVRVYDPSGRLIYRGRYENVPLKRGVFFIVDGRKVLRVIRR